MQTDIHFSPSFAVALVHPAPGAEVSFAPALPGDIVEWARTGPGRIYLQTRSPESFLAWLVPRLPTNRS